MDSGNGGKGSQALKESRRPPGEVSPDEARAPVIAKNPIRLFGGNAIVLIEFPLLAQQSWLAEAAEKLPLYFLHDLHLTQVHTVQLNA